MVVWKVKFGWVVLKSFVLRGLAISISIDWTSGMLFQTWNHQEYIGVLTMLASANSVVWTCVMLPLSNRSFASNISWGLRPYMVMALVKVVRFSSWKTHNQGKPIVTQIKTEVRKDSGRVRLPKTWLETLGLDRFSKWKNGALAIIHYKQYTHIRMQQLSLICWFLKE